MTNVVLFVIHAFLYSYSYIPILYDLIVINIVIDYPGVFRILVLLLKHDCKW